MNDLVHPAVRESPPAELRGLRERTPLLSLLRKDVASNGPAWRPLGLVLGAICAGAYAAPLVSSVSLVSPSIPPPPLSPFFLPMPISHPPILSSSCFHPS